MRTQLKLAALALLLSTLNPQLSTVFAQGSLTPPGAPAPTMKSLAQIEPRTPISSAPYTISAPGSYYLTTNVTVSSGNGITVAAHGVTLDLNGFTIASTASTAAGTAILLSGGLRNIILQNGFIKGGVTNNGSGIYSGSGWGYGVSFNSGAPANVLVRQLSISGCLNTAVYLGLGESTLVESCTVRTAGSYGLYASAVRSSTAVDCGSLAIYGDLVADCRGQSYASGISAVTAQNCCGEGGSGDGIVARAAVNCYGTSAGGAGINTFNAANCYGNSTNSHGLYSLTAQNCCGVSVSGSGISLLVGLNCLGSSTSGDGISTTLAHNCWGQSLGNGNGILVTYSAENCYGYSAGSGSGIDAINAQNCTGVSDSGCGIVCGGTAMSCYGQSNTGAAGIKAGVSAFCAAYRNAGTAIQATVANGCYAQSGTNKITYKYNMP